MATKRPKFSIIFPHIRTGPIFDRAFASIKNQTFKDFELISDSHVGTPGEAINRCLDKASGELIVWAYDDDICLLDKLEVFALYADKYKDHDIFYAGHFAINHNNNLINVYIPRTFDYKFLKEYGNYISTASTAVRLDKIKGLRFREDYPVCDEYIFWLDCYKRGLKFKRICLPVSCVRHWKDSRTYKLHKEKCDEHDRIKEEFGKEYYSKRIYKHEAFGIKSITEGSQNENTIIKPMEKCVG